LPGANCGGCGYSGCAQLAEAIAKGEAKPNACSVGGNAVAKAIGRIMGVEAERTVRERAQVMCSGTGNLATKKYVYRGVADCVAAQQLGGGDKLCSYGCIGLGTCVAACPYDAIEVVDGVAVVDSRKCRGCGACVRSCPRGLIEMIPYGATQWVACKSQEKGAATRAQCRVGCIGCRICERNCPEKAIEVSNFLAKIDYSKCTGCNICVEKCPQKTIWSAKIDSGRLVITREMPKEKVK
jgi:electron transport complex protein RnfB